jgi:hypothetical protein
VKYPTPAAHFEGRSQATPAACRQQHVTPVSAPLHVITVVTNPQRFYSRYRLYRGFEKMCAEAGAVLTTIELAVRDRHHEITCHTNPNHLQLRSPDVLWHKENLLNVGVRHVLWRYPDAEYFAWVDADVQFARPDWATETIQQLQIYRVVQMWSHAIDLGPELQPIAQCQSFCSSYLKDRSLLKPRSGVRRGKGLFAERIAGRDAYTKPQGPGLLHTGYAWAARRSALTDLGGFGDIGVLGSGDRHMAYALVGEVAHSIPGGLHPTYGAYWQEWQARAEQYVQRKVGVVPGTLLHYWHGAKRDRRYGDRWQILRQNAFDWTKDLKKDMQGVWQLTERNWQLRDDILGYFASRNEDEVSLPEVTA